LTYANNLSQIKTDYVIPPGVEDSAFVSGEKRETVIREDGKQVTQATLLNGPRTPFAPQDSWDTYKNFQTNKFMSIDAVGITGSNGKFDYYLIRELKPDFGWQITEERKSIGGYECIKAVSQPFRGRMYEAWFAPEIPISNGPWKLGGLPGLILEAEDKKGQVKFIFESLLINPESPLAVHDPYEQSTLPRIDWEEYKKKTKEAEQRLFKSRAAKGIQQVGYKVTREESTD
jgi:GLPGLI family protein